jgi:hypothetical protein
MKFKKHISLILVFFLLVSNMGFGLNVHYCGDEIASVTPFYLKGTSIQQSDEEDCCGIVQRQKNNCCKDKFILVQKKAEDCIVKSFFSNSDLLFVCLEWNPILFSKTTNFKKYSITPYFCDANAPPFFKLYNQYVFYA